MSLVLISGGTGLIGTHITQKLVKKGIRLLFLQEKTKLLLTLLSHFLNGLLTIKS